jgi:hypothetical protein
VHLGDVAAHVYRTQNRSIAVRERIVGARDRHSNERDRDRHDKRK